MFSLWNEQHFCLISLIDWSKNSLFYNIPIMIKIFFDYNNIHLKYFACSFVIYHALYQPNQLMHEISHTVQSLHCCW